MRDFAEVRGDGTIDAATARDGLAVFGVDDRGLDKVDRAILGALCQQFRGGPVGLSTLAIAVGEQPETVEDVYEPFLIQQGLLARTPRGRVAMPAAYDHLGLTPPPPGRRPRPVRLTSIRVLLLDVLRTRRTLRSTLGSADREVLGEEGHRLRPRGLGRGLVVEHLRLVVVEGVAGGLDVEHEARPAGDRRGQRLDALGRDVGVRRAEVEQRRAASRRRGGRPSPGTPEP